MVLMPIVCTTNVQLFIFYLVHVSDEQGKIRFVITGCIHGKPSLVCKKQRIMKVWTNRRTKQKQYCPSTFSKLGAKKINHSSYNFEYIGLLLVTGMYEDKLPCYFQQFCSQAITVGLCCHPGHLLPCLYVVTKMVVSNPARSTISYNKNIKW